MVAQDHTYFGYDEINKIKVGIPQSARPYHQAVFGATGTGKSTILFSQMVDDIRQDRGFAFLDPHGNTAERLLYEIPEDKMKRVIYFNPADLEYPIGLNLLGKVKIGEKDFLVEDLLDILQSIWQIGSGEQQIPEGIDVLANALAALVDVPEGSTFLGVPRMLTDPYFRQQVARSIKNEVVRPYWTLEYANLLKSNRNTGRPILHRARRLTRPRVIRNIIGQTETRIDFEQVMNEGYFLIANLSRGKIRDQNTRLLGSFLLSQFLRATMAREGMPESERKPFTIYLDEFQYFAAQPGTLSTMLSEARKYKVGLVVANQYLDQLDKKLLAAVLGNVGTYITLRLHYEDAARMAKEFHHSWDAAKLVSLKKSEMYYKVKDSAYEEPREAKTIAMPEQPQAASKRAAAEARKRRLIKFCRQTYGRPRQEVEKEIKQFYESYKPQVNGTLRKTTPK